MSAPTTIDWNYQIRNRPALFPASLEVDNDPTSGPYHVSELLFDNSSGIYVDSSGEVSIFPVPTGAQQFDNTSLGGPYTGPVLYFDNATGIWVDGSLVATMLAAQLTQSGVISDFGGQQLSGPFVMAPNTTVRVATGYNPNVALTLQEAGLGLSLDAEGGPDAPNALITYTPFDAYGLLAVSCPGSFQLESSGLENGYLYLINHWSGSTLTLASTGSPSGIGGPGGIVLSAFSSFSGEMYNGSMSGPSLFDISDGTWGAAYSCGGTPGVIGVDAVGTSFVGGICTGVGSGTLGGDVTGTLGSSTLSAIQGIPVVASAPSVGDVLYYNGTDWIPQLPPSGGIAIGDPVSGGTPGDTLQVDGLGNLGQWVPWEIMQASGYVEVDGSGQVFAASPGGTGLSIDAAGNVTLGSSYGTLALPISGAATLTGTAGGSLEIDTSGNVIATCGSGAYAALQNTATTVQLYVSDSGTISATSTTGAAFQLDGFGNVRFTTTSGLFAVSASGDCYLFNSSGGEIELDPSGNVLLSPSPGLGFGVFGGGPASQQANASQADITAVVDPSAKSALQAIYNLLYAYGWAPATP
jgi:hypothetical protein